MLVVCSGGQLALLAAMRPYLERLYLHLFTNNHTPAEGDTETEYEDPVYPTYRIVPLSEWQFVRPTPAGHAVMRHEPVVFSRLSVDPPVFLYGYWVADSLGRLIWAERDPAGAFRLHQDERDYTVFPQLSLRTEPG